MNGDLRRLIGAYYCVATDDGGSWDERQLRRESIEDDIEDAIAALEARAAQAEAKLETAKGILRREARYCHAHAGSYATSDPERSQRHMDRGNRLIAEAETLT